MRKRLILFAIAIICVFALCGTVAAAETTDETGIAASDVDSSEVEDQFPQATNIQQGTEPSKNITVSGMVKKCYNNDPFSNVTINVEEDSNILSTTTTLEDGTYSVNFLSYGTVFTVSASYSGHKTSTKEVFAIYSSDPNDKNLYGVADFELGSTIYVSTTGNDLWDGSLPFHIPGTNIGPKATIQNAIYNVDAGGTVQIAAGTYYQGYLIIDRDVTLQGEGTTSTIIDGFAGLRVVNVNSAVTATISSLTIQNGRASGNAHAGGIWNQGTLTLTNCIIQNNRAGDGDPGFSGGNGGGIYNEGTLTINSCTISNNRAGNGSDGANGGHGGGIYNAGTLTINGCTISNNMAGNGGTGGNGGNGGAIYNEAGNKVTITKTVFTGNRAGSGGTGGTDGTGGVFYNSGINGEGSTTTTSSSDKSSTDTSMIKINFNRIVSNLPNAIVNLEKSTINAINNWWGSNDGPASGTNWGQVDVKPWIILTLFAPSTIYAGSSATITADFTKNSDQEDTSKEGYIPDGIPVQFTTNFGSIGSKSVTKYTVNGIATAIFRADEGLGAAFIQVNADNQLSTMNIIVSSPQEVIAAEKTVAIQPTGIAFCPLVLGVLLTLLGIVYPRLR